MRPFLAFALLLACTSANESERPVAPSIPPARPVAAPPVPSSLHLESHRRVSWGYGCGGKCAQNTHGESQVVLTVEGDTVSAVDSGQTTSTHASPGLLATEKRQWSMTWHGTVVRGERSMTLRLSADSHTCSVSEDRGAGERRTPCKHGPPPRLVIACAGDEVEVGFEKRPAWRCEPDPAIPGGEWNGTPFPWVFGMDDPIDTIHAGEPEPRTRYELRAN